MSKDFLDEKLYSSFILKHMPRVLSQINRDSDMPTYGSCDRNYWHLNIRDFSSAILQQTCLTLALLYKQDFTGNCCYANENVREWSVAALRYMEKIQLGDGSFNEYYPNEHGFPPTAFNLFAGCETYRLLQLDDKDILHALGKAAKWLCNHDEIDACNQAWAAIAGLYKYYLITNEKSILDIVRRKVDSVLALYSEEGWFPEQGGADMGYSSVTLDMLTEYYAESRDERLKPVIVRMVEFLSHFVHPDGTIGGEYGSRNTTYFLPAGLETCVQLHLNEETAKAIIQKLYSENEEIGFCDSIDDRYLSHYIMHSWLRALARFTSRPRTQKALPFCTVHRAYFSESGLMTLFNGEYYAVANLKKGGLLKIFRENKELFCDCGYRIPIDKGKVAVTNWLDREYEIFVNENEFTVRGKFSLVKLRVQNPGYHFLLRISALICGGRLHNDIKRMTIFQNTHYGAWFERKVIFGNDTVQVEDTVNNPTQKTVCRAPNTSLRLVASGKFFGYSDLLNPVLTNYGCSKMLKISKTFLIPDREMKETVVTEIPASPF